MPNCFITLDVGGTNTRVAILDEGSEIRNFRRFATPYRKPDELLTRIRQAVFEIQADLGTQTKPAGMGMAVAGLVAGGMLKRDIKLGLSEQDLHAFMREFGTKYTVVENDAVAQAMGEYEEFSKEKQYGIFAYLTFGTGVGSAILLNGQPLCGSRGFASGLGHTIVDPQGPKCGCGAQGCLEATVGGEALRNHYGREAQQILSSAETDDIAQDIGFKIAQVVSNLYRTIDPDITVFGGGMMNAFARLYPHIERGLELYLSSYLRQGVRISRSRLADASGLFGIRRLLMGKIQHVE